MSNVPKCRQMWKKVFKIIILAPYSTFINKINIFIEKCWLHVTEGNVSDPITAFTTESLELCREKQALRLETTSKSKYSTIVLPAEADGVVGYHKMCFRFFTAVKKKPLCDQQCNGRYIYVISGRKYIAVVLASIIRTFYELI